MTRAWTLAAVSLAGLALAASGCGDSADSSRPAQLGQPAVDPKDQLEFGRNAARVGGISPADVAGAAMLAAYPPGKLEPTAWFLLREDKWREAVLSAQFASIPINAALMPVKKDFIPTATVDLLSRVKVKAYPKAQGLKAIVMAKVGPDVFLDLTERELKATALTAENPYLLGEKLVPFQGGGAGKFSSNIVIASAESRDYALPAAAWSAYSGDTLVFVTRDGIPDATARVLAQRQKLRLERPTMYVIGPEKVISDGVASQLAGYGRVERIAGPSAVETAVELAKYYDPQTLFGWNMKKGPASFSLVNPKDWGNAIGAWTFAAVGPQAPLLLTQSSDALPTPVARYLSELGKSGKPSQGFVFGDRNSLSSAVFTAFDSALEGSG